MRRDAHKKGDESFTTTEREGKAIARLPRRVARAHALAAKLFSNPARLKEIMKAIFTTRIGSGYDDVVEERYHFPATYLNQVRNAVGDLIVYYEPRRQSGAATGGRQAYFAVARVTGIEPDFARQDHYYAAIGDYLDFDAPVPFRLGARFFESLLERPDGSTNKGAFGRSVRNISDAEFDAILTAGFARQPVSDFEPISNDSFDESDAEFIRPMAEVTETRLFRDRAFARHIQGAYEKTCAVTGLKIINGGGRPEVQAAHIKPVAAHGSDSVRNGLALSGTVHWMFDRGLLSVDSDYTILTSRSGVPDAVRRLINSSGRLLLPKEKVVWPHDHFLAYHRNEVFKP